jgi:peptidoglycan-N-acetylglucosamine deacetylase
VPAVAAPEPARGRSQGGTLCLTFDVDAESVMLAADPANEARASLMSHQAYGPLIGVPRILSLLARLKVDATFFVPGATAERYPGTVAAILAEGHEVAHHGYLHESLVDSDEASERHYLELGLEALDRIAGIRPVGYRAPWWETTHRTRELLIEYGFGYDSSFFDSDAPYWFRAGTRRLLEIPVSWALDDWERYAFWPGVTGDGRIDRPSAVAAAWWEEIDAIRAVGGVAVLTMHPFLSGRPARAAALEALIERVLASPGLSVARLGDLLGHEDAPGADDISHSLTSGR